MIRYLIKNNFKLMFRNTWSVVVMLLGPILVIAVLSSAFSELMKSYEGVDDFTVGYRVEAGGKDNVDFTSFKLAGEKNGILFYEYPQGEIKDVMEKNELAGFMGFTKDKFRLRMILYCQWKNWNLCLRLIRETIMASFISYIFAGVV